jgi:hypothetical protein
MRNLILFLLPAITFAQFEISTVNRDYSEALEFTNHVRQYYGYSSIVHDDDLAKTAKKSALDYLNNQDELQGENTLVYLVDKHQFTLKDTYITDAVVAWSVDTDLHTRRETFTQLINYDAKKVGFAIVEKNGMVCVTAKFDE